MRRAPRLFMAPVQVFLLALMLAVAAWHGSASAQGVDWVLNMNDDGFDPLPDGSSVPAGGTVTYDIRVSNAGISGAPETTLELDIPADATLTGTSGTIGSCAPLPATGPATVICDVPALGPDEEARLAADVVMDREDTFEITARVPTDGDDDPLNNAATEGTTIAAGADIDLSLSGPASAASGDTVTYTFTAENLGPNALDSAVLEFPVPTGLANITPPAGCTLSGGTYRCDIAGPVAAGDSVTLDFQGQVAAAAGSTVTPVGSVIEGAPGDPITDNNTASFDMAVTGGSDVAMAKSRAPGGTVLVGDDVTFTLSPSYTGSTPTGLSITDTVPPNYQIGSVVPAPGSGWVCDVAGQDVTCTKPSGSGAGANVSLGDIAINATAISAGSPANSATITADGPADPNPANNTDNDGGVTITDPVVDLRANKSGPTPALVVVGNTYGFPISTTNVGNAPFFGTVIMTDDLPAGLTYTGATQNGWTCTPPAPLEGPAQIVCERVYTEAAPLEPGATTPSAVINAEATAPGTIVNSMTVSSPDANIEDSNPANDTTTTTVAGSEDSASADITLNKSASLATLQAGDVQTFTLEVVNTGPETSRDIEVTDVFSRLINNNVGATGAGYIGEVVTANAASGVSCSTANAGGFGRRLTCDIVELPVCTAGNDCPVITVEVRPGGDPGTRTNTAEAISATTADPNYGNNEGSASFEVEARTDVTLTKVGTPDPVAAGQELTYVLTASAAQGYSRAEAVTVTDTLPDDVTFISASPSTGSCSAQPAVGSTTGAGNNQVVCDLGTIEADAQQTVTIVVRPNTATRSTTLRNTATVVTDTPETDTTNNDATRDVQVLDPALDLLVNKTDSLDPVAMGQDTIYTISVTNRGPSAAENVVMTDDMPATGLSYVSHTVPADGACSMVPAVDQVGGQLVCEFPVLGAGQTRQITLTARGTAKGTVTNNVSVTSDEAQFDTNPGNNTADERTTVRTRADLAITKTGPGAPVNLRDPFSFTIEVRNLTGALLAEADDVVVSDTLPGDMVLTGAPVASVTTGSASSLACIGGANDTDFTCDLGTLSSGGVVTIDVPVKLTRVTSYPQDFTNQTSVTTTSLDVDETNNSDSATVTVNSSTLSGNVFRDFNDNGAVDGEDTGISGVPVTLTGTSTDGEPFTATATTDANGDFTFPYVPEGTYTITRGEPGEPHLEDGQASTGSGGGTVSSPREITGVTVGANTDETDYLFGLVPQARIGIAKRVQDGPTANADGSFNVAFRLNVENLSLEPLVNVAITDPLGAFGSHVALADPAMGTLAAGSYTVLSPPSGSCGGTNGGFDGGGDQDIASGISLAARASCEIDFALRVRPNAPSDTYENQATVTGEGGLTGQTPGTNPQLTDPSNNGADPDPNGNGIANEPGENTPTPVAPAFQQRIELVKTGTAPATFAPGEEIAYSFTVTNTGEVTLSDVTVTDPLLGGLLAGGPITLAPGDSDSTTFSGTYTLDQDDIDAGEVPNTATTTGTDPFDRDVTDSDSALTGLDRLPGISLTKSADASAIADPTQPGDEITYTFVVENTGNVTLTNVEIDDPLLGGTVPDVAATLAPGESDTVTATYQVTVADIDAGLVDNAATASGTGPSGTGVSDDDTTSTPLAQAPEITLTKTGTAPDSPQVGDTITYIFTVENTGNVTVSNITISDPMLDGPVSGGPITLAPGEMNTDAFTGSYTLTLEDLDKGQVENSATATGETPGGDPVEDDDTETTLVTQEPSIALIKRADLSALSDPPAANDVITYRFEVRNTGNVTLTDVTIDDAMLGGTVPGGPITLAPGETDSTTFFADYVLQQAEIDGREVTNQAIATGTPPTGPDVTDDSGTDFDNDAPTVVNFDHEPAISLTKSADASGFSTPPQVGDEITYTFEIENTGNVTLTNLRLDDPLLGGAVDGTVASLAPGQIDTVTASYALTIADLDAGQLDNTATATGTDPAGNDQSDSDSTSTQIAQTPGIALVKTADASALSDPAVVGQTITYGFTVTNTGNVTLTDVTVDDPLLGGVLPGGPITLEPGEADSATFSASYDLTQGDIDAGKVENTATATGTPPTGGDVSDVSGTDNQNDDPTIVPVAQAADIELVKTAQDEIFESEMAQPGDPLEFTFAVTNTGNVTLTNVTIADALAGVSLNGTIASLAPGEQDTDSITATYVLTEADIAAGEVVNTATVTGNYSDGGGDPQTVTDESTDTAIVTSIEALSETFPPFTEDGGTTTSILDSDTLRGGPADLTNVTIRVIDEDEGATLDPETALITLAPGQPAGDYQVTYEICSIDHPAICDQAVETVRQMPRPGIEVVKTQDLTDNGDGIDGVGDLVTYTITVENTGNTPIGNLTLTDVFTAMDGTPLTLDTGPDFDSASEGSPEGELQIGETATYRATYELTIEAVSGGGLSNRATAEGDPVYPPEIDDPQEPVSDESSDGSGLDGPTDLPIDPSLAPTGLTVEKTALRRVVERGSVVPYTITVKNDNPVVSGVLNIVDVLPAGFLYQPDSATLEGEPANVEVAGRVVTWTDVPVPPLTTVTLGIAARVTTGADPGEHVNKVSLRDPANNALLAPVATATVRIMPEPVFDCGDVIGTVFDDENRDGYQNQGEIGIPAARVVGVDGTIITTDEHGRFHVPCAMLPADRGSNFILKLDTRSLPSGYRVTTENPRVRRLTPGKMSEINFGAAITRVVRVDLNDRAFAADTDGRLGLGRPLAEGIANLLPRIAGEPVNLRLAYHLPAAASADDVRAARARMRLVERHIRKEWRGTGRVKLTIEQTLVRSSQ